jgi:uncharacterized protein (TIGR02646 family)
MKPLQRPPEPEILSQFGANWTTRYVRRRSLNHSATFHWPALPKTVRTHRKEQLNHRLLPILSAMSDHCCAFCDIRPVQGISIEHHKPKSRYPEAAYAWDNLFLCCPDCQKRKLERYHVALLRPDVAGYKFETYFIWEFESGRIRSNPLASQEQQRAAKLTICLYDLNHPRHRNHRRGQRRIWKKLAADGRDIADFSYPAYITADAEPELAALPKIEATNTPPT